MSEKSLIHLAALQEKLQSDYANLERKLEACLKESENCSALLTANNKLLESNNSSLKDLLSRFNAIESHLEQLPSIDKLQELERLRAGILQNTLSMNKYIEELGVLRSEYWKLHGEYQSLHAMIGGKL